MEQRETKRQRIEAAAQLLRPLLEDPERAKVPLESWLCPHCLKTNLSVMPFVAERWRKEGCCDCTNSAAAGEEAPPQPAAAGSKKKASAPAASAPAAKRKPKKDADSDWTPAAAAAAAAAALSTRAAAAAAAGGSQGGSAEVVDAATAVFREKLQTVAARLSRFDRDLTDPFQRDPSAPSAAARAAPLQPQWLGRSDCCAPDAACVCVVLRLFVSMSVCACACAVCVCVHVRVSVCLCVCVFCVSVCVCVCVSVCVCGPDPGGAAQVGSPATSTACRARCTSS